MVSSSINEKLPLCPSSLTLKRPIKKYFLNGYADTARSRSTTLAETIGMSQTTTPAVPCVLSSWTSTWVRVYCSFLFLLLRIYDEYVLRTAAGCVLYYYSVSCVRAMYDLQLGAAVSCIIRKRKIRSSALYCCITYLVPGTIQQQHNNFLHFFVHLL